MKTHIVRIGNSRGLRLPKTVLEQCKLENTVEIEVEDNCLVVRPARAARAGWHEAFAAMAQHKDDILLDRDALKPTDWDMTEWRW